MAGTPLPLPGTNKDWLAKITSEALCAEECFKSYGCNAYEWGGNKCKTFTAPYPTLIMGDATTAGFTCNALRKPYTE